MQTFTTSHKVHHMKGNVNSFPNLDRDVFCELVHNSLLHHFGFNLHWMPSLLVHANWFTLNFYSWVDLSPILKFSPPFFLLGAKKCTMGLHLIISLGINKVFNPWYHLTNRRVCPMGSFECLEIKIGCWW